MRRAVWLLLLSAALVFAGCFGEGDGDSEPSCGYPAAPEGAATLLHVSPKCAGAEADGSVDRPFETITEALAAAGGDPATILVAAGMYAESLRIESDGVQIVSGPGPAGDSPVAESLPLAGIKPPKGEVGIHVKGAKSVTIVAVGIYSAHGAGVRVEAAELSLRSVTVMDTQPAPGGTGGHGVHVLKGSELDMDTCLVTGSAGVGVHLSEAVGIILNNHVGSNAGGGIRIERPTEPARVEKNTIQKNTRFGVAMVEARGIILNNLVSETGSSEGSEVADGIHVTGKGADVEVRDNSVESNERVGVLFSTEALGIILNNLISKNGRGGVVLQAGAGKSEKVRIEDNTVTANAFVGVSMTTETMGIILNNLISETSPGEAKASNEVQMGDGVALMADAWGEVRGNTISGNARAAVLAHACDEGTVITQNVTTDNVYGVVVQGAELATEPSENDEDGGKHGGTEPPGPQGLPDDSLGVNQADVETL